MTHRISLPPELEEKLRERAAAVGRDADTFIIETLEEKLLPRKSFREIFSPLNEAFAAGDISDDELKSIVDRARDDHYRATQSDNK